MVEIILIKNRVKTVIWTVFNMSVYVLKGRLVKKVLCLDIYVLWLLWVKLWLFSRPTFIRGFKLDSLFMSGHVPFLSFPFSLKPICTSPSYTCTEDCMFAKKVEALGEMPRRPFWERWAAKRAASASASACALSALILRPHPHEGRHHTWRLDRMCRKRSIWP